MADSPRGSLPIVVRVLLEFTTIVIGVLAALGVDQWSQDRNDRALEANYVARLIQEVSQDTANHSTWTALIQAKEASLLRIDDFLSGGQPEEPTVEALLGDIGAATNFAWNVGPLTVTATFDDLRGSGTLGLIRDPQLRFALVRYYDSAEGADRRIEARRTGFPDISYRLFRRSPAGSEAIPELPSSADETARILAAIRDSGLGEHVTAEINRARFTTTMLTQLHAEATELLEELDRYAATF